MLEPGLEAAFRADGPAGKSSLPTMRLAYAETHVAGVDVDVMREVRRRALDLLD